MSLLGSTTSMKGILDGSWFSERKVLLNNFRHSSRYPWLKASCEEGLGKCGGLGDTPGCDTIIAMFLSASEYRAISFSMMLMESSRPALPVRLMTFKLVQATPRLRNDVCSARFQAPLLIVAVFWSLVSLKSSLGGPRVEGLNSTRFKEGLSPND